MAQYAVRQRRLPGSHVSNQRMDSDPGSVLALTAEAYTGLAAELRGWGAR